MRGSFGGSFKAYIEVNISFSLGAVKNQKRGVSLASVVGFVV